MQDTVGQMRVPKHDVLAAGFPCQPFSKSGFQRGMDEARGTLFWNICEILRVRKPTVVLLENVRNIAGPRHTHEWDVIIRSLRDLGYQVSSKPIVFSPHLLPPERGGRPQVRERVFIMGTYVGKKLAHHDVDPAVPHAPVDGWLPDQWRLNDHLPLEDSLDAQTALRSRLGGAESTWIDAWNDFVITMRAHGVEKLPGFPVWVDAWVQKDDLIVEDGTPDWKANFLRKNAEFYTQHSGSPRGVVGALGLPPRLPSVATQVRMASPDAPRRWTRRSCTYARPDFAPSEPPMSRHLSPSLRRASWATDVVAFRPARWHASRACPSGSTSARSGRRPATSRPAMA